MTGDLTKEQGLDKMLVEGKEMTDEDKKRFLGHGWSDIDGDGLNIGTIPGRKGIALYTEKAGALTVLAWFTDKEGAFEALRILDKWIIR